MVAFVVCEDNAPYNWAVDPGNVNPSTLSRRQMEETSEPKPSTWSKKVPHGSAYNLEPGKNIFESMGID